MEAPVVQLMPLAQQEISEKQLQVLRGLMDAALEVIVVGANERISEILCVLRENVTIKTEKDDDTSVVFLATSTE